MHADQHLRLHAESLSLSHHFASASAQRPCPAALPSHSGHRHDPAILAVMDAQSIDGLPSLTGNPADVIWQLQGTDLTDPDAVTAVNHLVQTCMYHLSSALQSATQQSYPAARSRTPAADLHLVGARQRSDPGASGECGQSQVVAPAVDCHAWTLCLRHILLACSSGPELLQVCPVSLEQCMTDPSAGHIAYSVEMQRQCCL